MEYDFRKIEQYWKVYWDKNLVYKISNQSDRPKLYVLDMFPYPSGAGLHVGHPLGYIASDIYARYKRLKGYNVLHPMGYDAFGLPAEQYAIETGQHPAITTEKNIARYREQLDKIGFSFDWSREVKTSDPGYYKWTQWMFLQLFHSWYNKKENKTKPIAELVEIFQAEGNKNHPCPKDEQISFDNTEWKNYTEKEQRDILMQYRVAYLDYAEVWWCEALGTVLANDEVVNGVSERGGHPVVKKQMRQWFLRITEYADRLLTSLDTLEWSDAMKDMQRNWIGKSNGAEIKFDLTPNPSPKMERGSNTPKYSVQTLKQYELARQNRKGFTEAEDLLWQHLRNNQLDEKFRRQHPIDAFIVDFICLQKRLIIEVDGGYHSTVEQKELDKYRTESLEHLGFKVIRFTNEEVLLNTANTIEVIKQSLIREVTPSPFMEKGLGVEVFTTRPDTIFGVDFMVLAPEHELVDIITTAEQKKAVEAYKEYVQSRSERERMTEVKQVTGCFTGAYVIHPFTENKIPVWISEYVLAGYGTGAIMAVPSGDQRDHVFAKHFNIPVTNIFGDQYNGEEAHADKTGKLQNSGFLSGMNVTEALEAAIKAIEQKGIGKRKVNYKLRDAGFSRQRYWGEPFPIIYIDGIPYATDESPVKENAALNKLPVVLPHVDSYSPGPEGQGPLANIKDWVNTPLGARETNTMPGYAASSWYFLRYTDPHNENEFASRKAIDYWGQVDLYVGGSEHAVGHLLYSRMWTKALCDLGYIGFDEPFKKLINQGMIQGSSRFVYLINASFSTTYRHEGRRPLIYVSKNIFDSIINNESTVIEKLKKILEGIYNSIDVHVLSTYPVHVDIKLVNGVELNIEEFIKIKEDAVLVLDDLSISSTFELSTTGKYICGAETEKMSKSKYNVVNPDDIVEQYGADTFRMYEMFLGPVEMSKPWDTKGIEGVHRFLKKMWRLYEDEQNGWIVTDDDATEAELRILHKTLKKISEDIERFAFNTSVSQFMICVNELSALNCHKTAILHPLAVAICPFAPHMAEELWHKLGNETSVMDAAFPAFEEKYVTENSKKYPVSVNGKPRVEIEFPLDMEQTLIEQEVLANDTIKKWLDGKAPKKIIYVKGKMINVVV